MGLDLYPRSMRRRVVRVLALVLMMPIASNSNTAPASAVPGTYSFTNAGSTGNLGPIQESVTAAYAGTSLAGQVTVSTRGIQLWTVPITDTYSVTAAGASGGYVPNQLGGKGRVITTQIRLTQGQVLKILVGQEGSRLTFSQGWAGGGGGGTFVVDSSGNTPLLVAGGGGGASQTDSGHSNSTGSPGQNANLYNLTAGVAGDGSGSAAGGTSGAGGASGSTWTGGSGAGFTGNGGTGTYSTGGTSFTNGGTGSTNFGNGTIALNLPGGFGGGGGAVGVVSFQISAGGGGGYSGGGGGQNVTTGGGGGGGNYFTGTYVSNSLNTGHGYVTFTRMNLAPASIALNSSPTATLRTQSSITATTNSPGTVTFTNNGKRIAGCIQLKTQVSGSDYVATCNWKPSVRGSSNIIASITPTGDFNPGTSSILSIAVNGRTNKR